MAARIGIVTGIEELDANLRELAGPAINRITRAAVAAGGKILARYQRAAAPVGPTGMLAQSIGSRVVRISGSGGVITAKSGINVGKRPLGRTKNLAPHSHLVALGTKLRTRERIGGKFRYLEPNQFHPQPPRSRSTGIMPANPFIKTSSAAAAGSVRFAIREAVTKGIAKEVNKIGARTGRAVGGVL